MDSGGRLVRSRLFVDGHVIQNRPLRKNLREFLDSKGLLHLDGYDYVLDRKKISQLQISLSELREGGVNPGVWALLDEFVSKY